MSKSHKHAPDTSVPAVHKDEDEVVHVPKGQSKLRFLLTLGLMLFVLVIFTVGDQLMGTFGGRGSSRAGDYMTWEHPVDGTLGLAYPEFVQAKRAIDNFFRAQGQRADRTQTEDERIAYLLITDRLARDAGIEIPKSEVARILREGLPGLVARPFFNKENYLAALAGARVSPTEFEATLCWLLRTSRYEGMLAFALGTPDAAAIETSWKEQHQEYAFDAIGVASADQRDQADLDAPDDTALGEWYAALGQGDKSALFFDHFQPERVSAALISWTPGTELPAQLLERYPPAEGTDPAEVGRKYYDDLRQVRFLRDDPEPEDGEEGADLQARLYLPYEEVAAAAADEGSVRAALTALLADLRARRSAGEEPDLAALAAELGLTFESDGVPRSFDAWGERGDPQLALALRFPGTANLVRDPVVGSTRLWLGQVLERQPSAPPAFDDVREEVRTAWSERRAQELALGRVEGLYASLLAAAGTTPEEGAELPASVEVGDEAFAAALAEAGLSAQRVDWFDPARAALEEGAEPADRFLRDNYFPGAPLYALAAGQVAAPISAPDGEWAWLVRSLGARDPERIDIRPAEYGTLRQSALFLGASAAYEAFSQVTERYGVRFPGRSEDVEDDLGT